MSGLPSRQTIRTANAASILREANGLLEARYGTPRLGNKRHPVSELVFIILSARTRGRHHEKIYRELRRRFRRWEAVRDAPVRAIETVIRDAGLSRIKAQQIKTLLRRLTRDFGSLAAGPLRRMNTEELESYLAGLPGVGLKTARCVMMYALDRPVFPVDTHCMRLFVNLGLMDERMRFEYAQDLLQDAVPADIRKTLHVNTVAHGRQTCIPRFERCERCVIADMCCNRRDGRGLEDRLAKTRVHKAGVFFDCAECGKLLRDCGEHNAASPAECPHCGGALVVVGIGNAMVQNAVWSRCRACSRLWMKRRGELVETRPRSGFDHYA